MYKNTYTNLRRLCILTSHERSKIMKNIIHLGRTTPFSLQKSSLKMLNFRIFLPPKEPLVAMFGKVCAFMSIKYVSKPDITIPNLSDKRNFF